MTAALWVQWGPGLWRRTAATGAVYEVRAGAPTGDADARRHEVEGVRFWWRRNAERWRPAGDTLRLALEHAGGHLCAGEVTRLAAIVGTCAVCRRLERCGGGGDVMFFLGTHQPHWLADVRFRDVPLFVSRRTLARYKRLPRAVGQWALDSGGFTELSMHGRWTIGAVEYAAFVKRCHEEIGGLMWAAPQDWMCEPSILAKTGLTVEEHQRRTTENYLELRALGADVIPVVQGWTLAQYLSHVAQYAAAGVDLAALPVVGVGSVCRRNSAAEVERILRALSRLGIRCHAFGAKGELLARVADVVESADSLAWSFRARRSPPLDGCKHKSCANCARYALMWRSKQLARKAAPYQLTLSLEAA